MELEAIYDRKTGHETQYLPDKEAITLTEKEDNKMLQSIIDLDPLHLEHSHNIIDILKAISRRILAIQEKVDLHGDILMRQTIRDMCMVYHGKTDEEIRLDLKSRGDTDEEIDDILRRMNETKKRAGVK